MNEEQKNGGTQVSIVAVEEPVASPQKKTKVNGVDMVQYIQDEKGNYLAEVVTLNPEQALKSYSPEIQQNIAKLVDAMDLSNPELHHNFSAFGDVAMEPTLDNATEILESFRGTETDNSVFDDLLSIIQSTEGAKEDFESALTKIKARERKPLVKLANRLSKNRFQKRVAARGSQKLSRHASNTLVFLKELAKASDVAKQGLAENAAKIGMAEASDRAVVSQLEQYLVAGTLVLEKWRPLIDESKESNITTGGIVENVTRADVINRNADTLKGKLETLAAARGTYYLSLAQLKIAQSANDNIEQMIVKQRASILTVLGTELRNACLLERTNELKNLMDGAANMANTLVIHVTEKAVEGLKGAYAAAAMPPIKPETFVSALKTIADGARSYESLAREAQVESAKLQEAVKLCIKELQPALNGNPTLTNHLGITANAELGAPVSSSLETVSAADNNSALVF